MHAKRTLALNSLAEGSRAASAGASSCPSRIHSNAAALLPALAPIIAAYYNIILLLLSLVETDKNTKLQFVLNDCTLLRASCIYSEIPNPARVSRSLHSA